MSKSEQKSSLNIGSFSDNPEKEGFCVLYTGMGAGQTYVYANPKTKLTRVPEKSDKLSFMWVIWHTQIQI